MSSALRDWLDKPQVDRGIRLAADDGGWEYRGYGELASAARRTAAALIEAGVRPGDVVCVVLPTDFTCVETYFGVWAAGATVCLITPPLFQDGDDYVAHVAAILRQARPKLTISSAGLAELVGRAMQAAGLEGEPWLPRQAAAEADVQEAGELALLQFTSGSSGEPRGVMVTWDNLEANCELIARTAGFQDGHEVASWLPLYHDMGLIGCFITPISRQGDLWLMRPDQFIRDPARWIRCFATAKHTAAPPFAYAYVARRVKPEQLEGLDLSGWETALVGAEPIDPHGLEVFAQLLEPFGFSRKAFKPAYGMAETTLLVTMDNALREPLAVHPDPESLAFGQPVRILDRHTLGPASVGAKSGWVVGTGTPEEDVPVTIVDDDGRELPEGHLGEIVVGGASACRGYYAGAQGKSTRFIDGKVYTGDAGFFYDGQLFVLGRMGDSIKVRGRSVYVEDLEAKIAELTGLGKGRIVLTSVPGAGSKGVALFAETNAADWEGRVREFLRRRLGGDVTVTIVIGSGLIQRTSSGKPRRRYMWERLQAGRMEGARIIG
ncbi:MULTISPECIES: AMP-binding protein [Thermomonospora]|uniref:AMP-dependent synthetase and ligase n=1 Tax=Thermomonospora curvata (strain ATCC 19995 / DSM 43183 / JCM 3096 / KCTC 9072 / NBRC 15933 / NCIMB 10081 / Henssen B9) TaxID=471852 RepID=D1ACJ8_THECD|nr:MULTISPECIES: AMP-binding protein [Thermomonospora]ACY99257.1 AMP-dependent synthetase and ligase [Thermomonospora curvata DSM 43183]PKK12902.1 MAG: AMP-dependent synthetase [Thermomonospora sp. CIF 1]